ncbi:hypothetical protein [[Flexibacter] sp. ATCC 35103]|uniref:hypothetical protein n=1 Tax=[Flexibacter] sp. ATCC 35103 TaxID=1937528 RepID=UPI000F4F6CCE|nr:hypothetical protein [[Flexibacter] sp. ATCC 35103]
MSITEKKKQEAEAELKEWLQKPDREQEDYYRNIKKIEEELTLEKIRKSIRLPFKYLDNWYSNNFVYELLTNDSTDYKTLAVANEYYNIIIADKLADQYMNQNPPSLAFDKFGYWLANCLSQKRYTESETLLKIINKGLNTNFINGGVNFKPATWFIIEIANKGYNNTIDYSQYNYPENMGVYQEALKNWNTNDLNLLDNIVSKLCDYHLSQASYGDDENSIEIQFGQDNWFVYAFEILTWLSIREMVGLQNPEKFSHPLMDLELNKLTNESDSFPKNELSELFEKVMVRLDS